MMLNESVTYACSIFCWGRVREGVNVAIIVKLYCCKYCFRSATSCMRGGGGALYNFKSLHHFISYYEYATLLHAAMKLSQKDLQKVFMKG